VVAVGGEVQRGKRNFTAVRGFFHATKSVLWMRMPWRGQAGKQLHGWVRGGAGSSSPTGGLQCIPPFWSNVVGFIPSLLFFLNYFVILNRSQILVKTKVP